MRWLAILGVIFGVYYYFLTQTTNLALSQLQNIQNQYSSVAKYADRVAAGQ